MWEKPNQELIYKTMRWNWIDHIIRLEREGNADMAQERYGGGQKRLGRRENRSEEMKETQDVGYVWEDAKCS